MGDMKYVAGVDIGNATTEVALAKIDGQDIEFLTVVLDLQPESKELCRISAGFSCL